MRAPISLLAFFLALLAAVFPTQGSTINKLSLLLTTEKSIGQYTVLRSIGKGGHSLVYEVTPTNATDGPHYALKFLFHKCPIEAAKLEREIRILRHVSGGPGIIKLIDVFYHPQHEAPLLVMELARGGTLNEFVDLSERAARSYMYQLLRALDHIHSAGVIHRDVKFENILVDPTKESLLLVDFGYAQFTDEAQKHTPDYGTLRYTAPEVLVGQEVGPAADLWAAGALFGGMIFHRRDMFPDIDRDSRSKMLVAIADILGTDGLLKYLSKSGIRIRSGNTKTMLEGGLRPRPWKDFVTPKNKHLVSPEALDLLSRLLRYDPAERITARAALSHPYFNAIREQGA